MDVKHSASLLRTVLDRVAEDLQVATFSRLLYAAELLGTPDEVTAFLDDILATEQARDSIINGLVLIQNKTILHVAEAQPETAIALMRAIAQNVESDQPLFRNVRIVASTEDAPEPLFGALLVVRSAISSGSYGPLDFSGEGDIAIPCYQLYSRLLALGRELPASFGTDDEIREAQRDIPGRYAKLLPPDDVLLAVANNDRITSLREYLRLFGDPIRVRTAAEAALPPPAD